MLGISLAIHVVVTSASSLSSGSVTTTTTPVNTIGKSAISTSDEETLRSLGLSGVEIESLFGSETNNLKHENEEDKSSSVAEDGDRSFSMTEMPLITEENIYDEYDHSEYEYDDEELNKEGYKKIDSQEENEEDTSQSVVDDWWKDPLKQFTEGDDANLEESAHDINDPSHTTKEKDDKPLHETNPHRKNQVELSSDKSLEDELKDTNSDKRSSLERSSERPMSIGSKENENHKDSNRNCIEVNTKGVSNVQSKPKSFTTGNVRTISSPVIPVLVLSKFGKFIHSYPPLLRVVVSVVFGKYFLNSLKNSQLQLSSKQQQQQFKQSSTNEDGFDDEIALDEAGEEGYFDEAVEDLGFGRPRPKRRELATGEALSGEEDRLKTQTDQERGGRLWRLRSGKQQKWNETTRSSTNASKIEGGFFGIRSGKWEMRQMTEQLDDLKQRLKEAELAHDQCQLYCEDSKVELQESQRQVDKLSKTNGYLKAQLRDNQRILDRAISDERQRTNIELARVRDSMVSVLERERGIMRTQIMKASSEVKSMILDKDVGFGEELQYQHKDDE